jgi:hypothetical protein
MAILSPPFDMPDSRRNRLTLLADDMSTSLCQRHAIMLALDALLKIIIFGYFVAGAPILFEIAIGHIP